MNINFGNELSNPFIKWSLIFIALPVGFIVLAVLAHVEWLHIPTYVWRLASSSVGHLGTFGDFFGGILNPILSFITMMIVMATFLLQRLDSKLSRKHRELSILDKKSESTLLDFYKVVREWGVNDEANEKFKLAEDSADGTIIIRGSDDEQYNQMQDL